MEEQTTYTMLMKLQKKADKVMNRIIIPKSFIDKHGKQFYMEVYEDKIILKPIKKKGE